MYVLIYDVHIYVFLYACMCELCVHIFLYVQCTFTIKFTSVVNYYLQYVFLKWWGDGRNYLLFWFFIYNVDFFYLKERNDGHGKTDSDNSEEAEPTGAGGADGGGHQPSAALLHNGTLSSPGTESF